MECIFSDEIVGTSGAIQHPYPTTNIQYPPTNIHIHCRLSFWKVASTRNISIKQRLKLKSRDKASPIGNNNFADR